MFLGQLATYIASFPVVLWLQEVHDFSVGEVGYLTVVGAFGNAAGCYVGGYGFDAAGRWKRLVLLIASLLSGGPYLLFLIAKGKPALYAVWTVISVGYGALYTVQVSQMRLLADKRVAAAYSGLCMGMLAAAAAVGTYSGGLLTEYISGGDYTICYSVGAGFCLFGVMVIPWIQAEDKEMMEFKVRQRADRMKREGKRARRRSSYRRLVARVKGTDAVLDMELQDAMSDAINSSKAAPRPAKTMRRMGSATNVMSPLAELR
jgi:MFS family permease